MNGPNDSSPRKPHPATITRLKLAGLSISLLAFLLVWRWDAQLRQSEFDRLVHQYEAALYQELDQSLGSVWALAALFNASDRVDRSEFASFAQAAIAHSPGLVAAEWVPRVPRDQVRDFELAVRAELPGFRVNPFGTDEEDWLDSELFPIVFLEPAAGNEGLLGADLGSLPSRRAALDAARDSGKMVASPPLVPMQENNDRYGFLAIHPLYAPGQPTATAEQRHAACTGFVIGVFRIETLIERATADLKPMDLAFYDSDLDSPGKRLLYRKNARADENPWTRLIPPAESLLTLRLADRHLTLHLRSQRTPYDDLSFWLSWVVLLAGLATTALLAAYMRQIVERSRLIEQEVQTRTGELQRSRESLKTTLHDLQLSEGRLRNILDTALDGIIAADQNGIIRSLNPAAENIFGYAAHELLGQPVFSLMAESHRSRHQEMLRHYLDTGEHGIIGRIVEVEGRRRDGEIFPLELAVSEVAVDEDERLFIGIVRDIAERKRVERLKSEFVSTVSHELRTPLTAIRGSLGLIAGGAMGPLAEPVRKLLDIAANNCERLVRLINDILDMEKIESGKMNFQLRSQALMPLIRQAIETNRLYARQADVNIELVENGTSELHVMADNDRFMQVMTNLLSNAVKFSPPGGRVQVAVQATAENVRISVVDTGPGIPESFRPRLFEKFAQADSTDSRRKGGTGLGLAISKAIVEHFGGRLGYETEAGHGTRFHVDLPRLDSPEPAAATTQAPGPNILVVEDDPDIAQLLRLMLEKNGYAAVIAHDAEEARKRLATEVYAAMTLDLLLPGLSGLSLLDELRRGEHTARLPVIVVSAIADQARREISGNAVAVADWLSKPIDERRLIEAVRGGVKRRAGQKAAVLHVEDDADLQEVVAAQLREFAEVEPAATLAEAEAALDRRHFDLVILDIGLPDGSGLDLLPRLSGMLPPTPVVIFSAREPQDELRERVGAQLVKSRTESLHLIETIRALLANGNGDSP
ncbi:CHASE domain-containing protein [Methylococcus sp. EFPC2]|uniref:CHASE domain-containing protein n=1 Tax=Methylococcus sp. EFPC2 TaxID=2812648 RepID=UPI0019672F1A|nr:CHASE domain-containing protein [Methylococcus sp. EFPC2]QSA95660.1 CHASE domain-containing protein [Methylococcus sp. EFPC2]